MQYVQQPEQGAELSLVNLTGGGAFDFVLIFDRFPGEITADDAVNWQPQDVTVGIKPVFYANNEPQRISFEAWLDRTDTNDSVLTDIENLRRLMKVVDEPFPQGMPPLLQFTCGDWSQRVVLEKLSVRRVMFTRDNKAIRALVSVGLLEFAYEEFGFSPPRVRRKTKAEVQAEEERRLAFRGGA
jgi:hypothetical protein